MCKQKYKQIVRPYKQINKNCKYVNKSRKKKRTNNKQTHTGPGKRQKEMVQGSLMHTCIFDREDKGRPGAARATNVFSRPTSKEN